MKKYFTFLFVLSAMFVGNIASAQSSNVICVENLPDNASCDMDYETSIRAFGIENCPALTPTVGITPEHIGIQYACVQRNLPRFDDYYEWRLACTKRFGDWSSPAKTISSCEGEPEGGGITNPVNPPTNTITPPPQTIGGNTTRPPTQTSGGSQAQQIINLVNSLVAKYRQVITPSTNSPSVSAILNTGLNTNTVTNTTTNTTTSNTPITYGPNPTGPYIEPPVVSLTANGQKDITVNVGDPITYVWSTAASVAESSVIMDNGKAGACPEGRLAGLYYPWEVFTKSGTKTATVLPCQAGTIYTINFIAKYGPNNTYRVASQAVVRVRSASGVTPTPAAAPDFSITSFPSTASTHYINKSLAGANTPQAIAFLITVTPKNGFQGNVNLTLPFGSHNLSGGFVTGNSENPYTVSRQVTLLGDQPQNVSLLLSPNSSQLGQNTISLVASATAGGQPISHNLSYSIVVQ